MDHWNASRDNGSDLKKQLSDDAGQDPLNGMPQKRNYTYGGERCQQPLISAAPSNFVSAADIAARIRGGTNRTAQLQAEVAKVAIVPEGPNLPVGAAFFSGHLDSPYANQDSPFRCVADSSLLYPVAQSPFVEMYQGHYAPQAAAPVGHPGPHLCGSEYPPAVYGGGYIHPAAEASGTGPVLSFDPRMESQEREAMLLQHAYQQGAQDAAMAYSQALLPQSWHSVRMAR